MVGATMVDAAVGGGSVAGGVVAGEDVDVLVVASGGHVVGGGVVVVGAIVVVGIGLKVGDGIVVELASMVVTTAVGGGGMGSLGGPGSGAPHCAMRKARSPVIPMAPPALYERCMMCFFL